MRTKNSTKYLVYNKLGLSIEIFAKEGQNVMEQLQKCFTSEVTRRFKFLYHSHFKLSKRLVCFFLVKLLGFCSDICFILSIGKIWRRVVI